MFAIWLRERAFIDSTQSFASCYSVKEKPSGNDASAAASVGLRSIISALDESVPRDGSWVQLTQVLLAHGQRDEVLPFKDSERLHEILESKGVATHWHPFDDGHTITTDVLDETRNQLSQDRE